jgi:hypothetical protein
MEPEGSLPHSQVSATCPCPELSYSITQIIFHADTLLTSARPEWLKVAVTQYKEKHAQYTEKQPNAC